MFQPIACCWRVGLVLALCTAATARAGPEYDFDRRQLEAIVDDLKAWLPGAWDSYPQVWYDRNVAMPEEGEHEHWFRTFALIDAPQVGEVVFYGQINIGGRDGPLMARSQVLYKTVIDEARGVVSITGQGPADPQRFENLQDHPELWGEVRMRDESAMHCDFIWRRDGRALVGVLEGKAPEFRKYGPGTCNYIADSGAEFYADAEWVLTPDELWLYDINKIRDVQFIGRKDRTHIRLYRASPYRCVVRDSAVAEAREVNAHDRGFMAPVAAGDPQSMRWMLLRAWYPAADGFGLDEQLRLMLMAPGSAAELAMATAPGGAADIEVNAAGVDIACSRAPRFPPM